MDTEELRRFVREAGFVFRGRVLERHTRQAPPVPRDAGEVVAAHIEEVVRSTDALRGLAGHSAFILSRNDTALRRSHPLFFFTDILSVGHDLLLRDIAAVEATPETSGQLAEAIRVEHERPLRERVAAAELIVVGEVVESRVFERPFPPPSEHYADWGLARVAISAALKGSKRRGNIDVLFADSVDHVWFRSPKLHRGVRGILLLSRAEKGEHLPRELPQGCYQALDPLDLQPVERRAEIERLIGGDGGEEH